MRPEGNPLDLNNLPEDYGKQAVEESSTTTAGSTENTIKGLKKKKKEGKDESGKVYECRFCSLKFCKSQALGGHMNRHRQERETETLNRARQLVFSNDTIVGTGTHMGMRDLNLSFGGASAQAFQFRPVYPRQLPSQPQPPPHHQLHHPYNLYSTPPSSSTSPHSYQPPYPPPPLPRPPPVNDYYIGRPQSPNYATCFGSELPVSNPTSTERRGWTCTHRSYGHHSHDGL